VNEGVTPEFPSQLTAASLALPAGSYALTASVDISDNNGPSGLISCQIVAGNVFVDDAVVTTPAYAGVTGWAALSLNGAVTLGSNTTVTVQCGDLSGSTYVGRAHLSAVQGANITNE
jgi:hypothetical protein